MPIRLLRLDQAAMNRLLAASPELTRYLDRRLGEAKAYAESISPRDADGGTHYADSFMVEIAHFPDGVPIGHLKNTSPNWAAVEKGALAPRPQGGWSPPQHVLSRTLQWLHTT